ncbi:GAF domain-containing protein [Fulvimarina sp. 2208YS6-2-32]|uniref:histidine kinase n=1 Tax=Fulvimarina uroteuthidis TaxID=3098149 RepID=A0ABU5HWK2_9HYPH|nr:GAF domain-containing protein [Fulvimarina sp. 2208YS6-2-32]MDY8107534.1 GAF domain-containing protein [Fulvimarina sp. 2208YS6-2-32]
MAWKDGRLADWSIFGPEPEREFDRIARLATRYLRVPSAFITFMEANRQVFKSEVGLPEAWADLREAPIIHSLCSDVVAEGKPIVVADSRLNARLKDDPAIEALGVVAYLGVPIKLPTGERVGSFCAIDDRPNAWSDDDIGVLAELAELISREIELRFEVARREAAEAEILLVARELQHRARNAFSIVQAVISLSMRDKALMPLKLEIIDRISTVSSTQDLIARQPGGTVLFSDVVERELSPLARPESYHMAGSSVPIMANEAVFVGMIVHELVTNAVKHGALRPNSDGFLSLRWWSETEATDLRLHFLWRETNLGEAARLDPHESDESGFGSELLHILVTNQLKGSIERELNADGLTIRMQLRLASPPTVPALPASMGDGVV